MFLKLIDSCLVKGANFEQASNRLLKNHFSDLDAVKNLFLSQRISHIYYQTESGEKVSLSYNQEVFKPENLSKHQKTLISFLRRSTLSTEQNQQISLLKFKSPEKEFYKLYRNGIKLKVIEDIKIYELIEKQITEINSSKEENTSAKIKLFNILSQEMNLD